jgi:gliding motility-associated-like protein
MRTRSIPFQIALGGMLLPSAAFPQCEIDVCGYWYSENYNSGVPVEFVSIDLVGAELVATKVLGDAYVPTGHVTWYGVPSACTFAGQVYGTQGPGLAIYTVPGTISIQSQELITVLPFGLVFRPTTIEHMQSVGVDHSDFPVSCIDCKGEFPNVFTPNGDGVNDLLELHCGGQSSLFTIQDRWGRTVFETQEPKPSWDGRKGFDPCPEGVYFWSMIKMEDRTGKIRHGMIQLFR